MTDFAPKTTPQPFEFAGSHLSEEAQEVNRRARHIAEKLGYWYNATHHLFYSVLEFNFATDNSLHIDIGFPIVEFKNAMLRVDPPMRSDAQLLLPLATTSSVWNCFLFAIRKANSASRLATSADVFEGLLRYREFPVDSILGERGIRIGHEFKIETVKNIG